MVESQRLLKIGNALITGPMVLFPAGEDRGRYAASMLSARWSSENADEWKSVRLYGDASGDDATGYLDPMVRYAHWHRRTDLMFLPRPCWPSVSIELAKLPFESSDLQGAVFALQRAAVQAPFRACGLPTRRKFHEYQGDARGHLDIEVSSDWQHLSRSFFVAAAPQLHACVQKLEEVLRRLAIPVARSEWLEYYDHTPGEMPGSTGWYWDGQSGSIWPVTGETAAGS